MSNRMKKINDSFKRRESGNFPERFWYVSSDALEKAGLLAYKAEVGDNFIRFVPPLDEEGSSLSQFIAIGLELKVHYNIGVNNSAFICPQFLGKGPCPICDKVKVLRTAEKQADEADEELINTIKSLRGSTRYLFWMLDDEKPENGLQLYDAPASIQDGIMSISRNKKTKDIIDISDPDDGKALGFTRTGTGPMDTKYKSFSSEECDPITDEVLDAVLDFEDVIVLHDYNTIKSEFEGGMVEEEADEPEERPVRRSRRDKEELKEELDDELDETEDAPSEESAKDKIRDRLAKVRGKKEDKEDAPKRERKVRRNRR